MIKILEILNIFVFSSIVLTTCLTDIFIKPMQINNNFIGIMIVVCMVLILPNKGVNNE